ncbi:MULTISPECIES: ATP-binding cassette domain-containing protein [Roseomonadaceae]|uniref:ABC-F family ATP-binding cassette domain-containing protein n=1 Tax=Falsiroseomonas oleicola TaxID=2801474 RepID=A0ABS6HBN1_9PROT|nr:ATP-binding cassette domain-containing protein [Roseomonas oleicola]MBU8546093.1 ABC-F family ATP-binding cassette domain-containing protein [Roseomonas oleicola]
MSLITLEALGMSLGAPLFTNLDFTIHKGDRIGLVAHNGGGKSTLLRILAERSEPTAGRCRYGRNLRVTPMQQDPEPASLPLPVRDVLLQALPAESREWEGWRVDVALGAMEIPSELHDRPLGALSGGWQRMVLLVRAWLTEPDVLLMDEPTNHLDLQRIGQLQRWIAELPQDVALMVASHDRAFLDAVTRRTLFLRREASAEFAAPYSAARASLAELDEATARRHETELRHATRLRQQAAKLHNIGVNSGSDLLKVKTKQLQDRAARIEAAARPAYRGGSAGQIRLADGSSHARSLQTLDTLKVAAPGGRRLFTTGKLRIQPGDRVVLLGATAVASRGCCGWWAPNAPAMVFISAWLGQFRPSPFSSALTRAWNTGRRLASSDYIRFGAFLMLPKTIDAGKLPKQSYRAEKGGAKHSAEQAHLSGQSPAEGSRRAVLSTCRPKTGRRNYVFWGRSLMTASLPARRPGILISIFILKEISSTKKSFGIMDSSFRAIAPGSESRIALGSTPRVLVPALLAFNSLRRSAGKSSSRIWISSGEIAASSLECSEAFGGFSIAFYSSRGL